MSLKSILEQLPGDMPISEALEEAERIKRETHLARDRARVEVYRRNHMEEQRVRARKYYAKKKAEKLLTPGGDHELEK
jgi:hypothetical protein